MAAGDALTQEHGSFVVHRSKRQSCVSMNERQPKPEPSSSACEELRALLPAYVAGAADADEVARVRLLLDQCPEARAEIAEYAAATAGFYERIEPVMPPPELHARLMAQVRAQTAAPVSAATARRPTPAPAARVFPRRLLGWALAAAALLLIISNVYWLSQWSGLQNQLTALREQRDQAIALASATDLQRTALISTEANSDQALATLLWNAGSQSAVLTGLALPSLNTEQTFQLWLIADGQPVSAGVFAVDALGDGALRFSVDQPLQNYQAVAISVEPLGGSSAPTSAPIALGTLPTL